jgi:hypothetical protein
LKNHRPLLEGCNWAWQHHSSHQVKKNHGDSDQFVDDKPFIDKRKPLSMTVERGVLNSGKHTLIPVMARMIHIAVWNSERFVVKDGRPLHMVKLVGFLEVAYSFKKTLEYAEDDVLRAVLLK